MEFQLLQYGNYTQLCTVCRDKIGWRVKKEKSGDFGNPGSKINLISCVDLNDPMSLDSCFSSLPESIAYICLFSQQSHLTHFPCLIPLSLFCLWLWTLRAVRLWPGTNVALEKVIRRMASTHLKCTELSADFRNVFSPSFLLSSRINMELRSFCIYAGQSSSLGAVREQKTSAAIQQASVPLFARVWGILGPVASVHHSCLWTPIFTRWCEYLQNNQT